MIEPWFDASAYAWIPGTALGVLCGVWGSLVGVLAPRGRARTLVLGSLAFLLAAGLTCLILGIVAVVSGQPYGVWYGLLIGGALPVVILGGLARVVFMRYRDAELRKMQARDL
jgi:hypothetical protein